MMLMQKLSERAARTTAGLLLLVAAFAPNASSQSQQAIEACRNVNPSSAWQDCVKKIDERPRWVLLIPAQGQQNVTSYEARSRTWAISGEHESQADCENFRRIVTGVTAVKGDAGSAGAYNLGVCVPKADLEKIRR
jgi:hypothetical protein